MTHHELDPKALARSCHEALILAALADGPRHGYQLALEIEELSDGAFRFNHGTLYPILHKLEADGLIEGSWAEPTGKRKRRQYEITDDGRLRLADLRNAWNSFFHNLVTVIGRSE